MSLIFALPVLGLAFGGLLSWGPAILMIGGLIFVHELGHFLVARWMGMPVEVFSLGFGPRLVGFSWRGTDVRLSALPLGGYVKLLGFNPEEPEAEDPHGFLKQAAWKRQLFYAGGILFNVLTTFILLWVIGTAQARLTGPLQVTALTEKFPAAEAGLKVGDQIVGVGDLRFPPSDQDEALDLIRSSAGKPVRVDVLREGQPLTLTVVPQDAGGVGRIGMGFGLSSQHLAERSFRVGDLGRGLKVAAVGSWRMGTQILGGFARLFTFRAKLTELGGPIAIAKMGNEAAKAGWMAYLYMTAMISMNLAILNALPIPFLDGGHMVILALERLRGKDFTVAVKERILAGGFVVLASLMLLVMALDVWRLRH